MVTVRSADGSVRAAYQPASTASAEATVNQSIDSGPGTAAEASRA